MTAYFIRRLLLIVPTFLGITLVVFVITRFVPGGPVERYIAQSRNMATEVSKSMDNAMGTGTLSEEQLDELKQYYGFDKPVLVSYGSWLWKVLHLDLGYSTRYGEPVWDLIAERMPISIFYGVTTMLLTYLVCIPLGLLKALRHGKLVDNLTSTLVFAGYAIPNYVVGIGLLVLLASEWDIFPLSGFVSDDFEDLTLWGQAWDVLYHAILPLISYMAGSFAVMTLLMKNSVLDNLATDYVRTAMAKGLSFGGAIYKHALRNSLVPLATHFGNNISIILTGSFLIEKVFNIEGLGLLGIDSVIERDYPVVMGTLVISSLLFLIGNILSDLCVALVDPRVQFK